MIAKTEQVKGVEVILAEVKNVDEAVPRDIQAPGKPEAEDKDENTSCQIKLFG